MNMILKVNRAVKERHDQIIKRLKRGGKITGADANSNSISCICEFPDPIEKYLDFLVSLHLKSA